MDLDGLPDVRFEESGVTFKYLVLKCDSNGREKILVRGVNHRPYEPDAVQRIINWIWGELDAAGFQENRDVLAMEGGGTLSVNPYYETVTLFGGLPSVGPASDREATAKLVQSAFPDHKVEWFAAEEAKPKKAKAAKKPTVEPAKEEGDRAEEAEKSDA